MSKDSEWYGQEIKKVEKLIDSIASFKEIVHSELFKNAIERVNSDRLGAIEDYLKDNTPLNQSFAKFMNYFYNILLTYTNESELDNLLSRKERLIEELRRVERFESEMAGDKITGGAV